MLNIQSTQEMVGKGDKTEYDQDYLIIEEVLIIS